LATLMTNDLLGVLSQQSLSTLWWTYFFGAMWGFGGLTFGLTMRYLGMSLGMGVALGYCAAFGTLLPPIFKTFIPTDAVPQTIAEIAASSAGQVTLAGVAVCLIGIGIAALAGLAKEREMPEEEKKKAIAEFSFAKGILVATFSGIMSAGFSFALTAGNPIGEASKHAGTETLWTGLPKLCVVLLGGFTTNFIWCVLLNLRNGTGYQYFSPTLRQTPPRREEETIIETAIDAPSEEVVVHAPGTVAANGDHRVPLLANYFFSALAGTTWYFQFFFYTMGETQMGEFGFASWTLHMASIIIFSTLWGVVLREWKGSSRRTHVLIGLGIAVLIGSTIIVGCGNYLKATAAAH
jgi:L-rhamnose-H+ transport protein